MFKRIVFFVFLSIFSFSAFCSTNNTNISPNGDVSFKNIQSKDFEIIKIDEGLYASQIPYGDQKLYIGLQKITADTYSQWYDFIAQEEKFLKENARININIGNSSRSLSFVGVGLNYFKYPVHSYLISNNTDVWVAYISEDPITPSIKKSELILVVTVSSGEDIPFSTHMGFFKTTHEIIENKYKNISMYLHSFAGYLANQLFKGHPQKKEYMATTPADQMRRIMIKAMGGPDEIYNGKFYIGDKKTFLKWLEEEKEDEKVEKISLQELKNINKKSLKISEKNEKIREYFPWGVDGAPEPPLDFKDQYHWSFRLKEGNIIDFESTPINRKQSNENMPWVITDLDVLSKLYDWKLIQDSTENNTNRKN